MRRFNYKVLSENGGNIILLSDGEETDRPFIQDVRQEVINSVRLYKSVCVHSEY